MMKPGTTTRSGSRSGVVAGIRASATKSSTSLARACLSMKPRMWPEARLRASSLVICEARYGAIASWLMASQTGDMMKNVMNKARPTTIWFAGAACS